MNIAYLNHLIFHQTLSYISTNYKFGIMQKCGSNIGECYMELFNKIFLMPNLLILLAFVMSFDIRILVNARVSVPRLDTFFY